MSLRVLVLGILAFSSASRAQAEPRVLCARHTPEWTRTGDRLEASNIGTIVVVNPESRKAYWSTLDASTGLEGRDSPKGIVVTNVVTPAPWRVEGILEAKVSIGYVDTYPAVWQKVIRLRFENSKEGDGHARIVLEGKDLASMNEGTADWKNDSGEEQDFEWCSNRLEGN